MGKRNGTRHPLQAGASVQKINLFQLEKVVKQLS